MITVGVDLAAEAKNTAIAVLEWTTTRCVVRLLHDDVDDAAILTAAAAADKVGIDAPLGWPDAFVQFVLDHRDGHVTVPAGVAGIDWRRPLANRHTDLAVRRALPGLVPLSVSADRIAHPAMRAAGLLAQLAAAGLPVDRTGAGLVVEAYPAASLRQWGALVARGYKGRPNGGTLAALAADVLAKAPWLDLGAYREDFASCDDQFDAVIAALTARAAALDLTYPPDPEQQGFAKREGWIAVPKAGTGLDQLLTR